MTVAMSMRSAGAEPIAPGQLARDTAPAGQCCRLPKQEELQK